MTLPVRFGHLRAYGKSAMHGQLARQQDGEQTYAMQRGTAVHAIVFNTRKVCGYPGKVRNGKDYVAFAAEHADHEILTMTLYDKSRRMADAVQACKLAEPYLKGTVEQTILFRWNGLDCRATPDVRGPEHITELKTSASSDPMRFVWHAIRMHYHGQMRMQQIALNDRKRECFIVCVESAEPFPVTVFRIDERALEVGERLLMLWSERLKGSEESGLYPPYVSCVVPFELPDDDETELIFEGVEDRELITQI